MMANTSLAGTTWVAAAITCARSGLPPTSCSTLGCLDFSLVPLPAARMAIAVLGARAGLLFAFGIRSNIPRELCAGQGYRGHWWIVWGGHSCPPPLTWILLAGSYPMRSQRTESG